MSALRIFSALLIFTLAFAGCTKNATRTETSSTAHAADVDDARIESADRDAANWLTHGRTYTEQRFSPLKEINDANVSQLGLAWHFDLDTHRGQEATPIVVDGVMYFTSAWSKVFAVDAATGKLLWSYDPKVPPEWAVNACCDVVNRGAAVWKGKVIFATLDGRIIALDAATGNKVWETLTIDPRWRYTITGAPRIVKGKVIIGNGGAEMSVRGYVSAYDAGSGKLIWRFYTVPGDPSKPFENPILAKAAKTWTGQWWKFGGGGTVWDSIVYDPELDLLYLGVGNGAPWNWHIRSPRGGDNLFLSSIVALRPDTGEYVWHYQETPAEMWDFTASQQITLADVTIDGQPRKLLFHAPKNGIFYVLDRATGALISAKPYTYINWATGVDMKTGRPVETPIARYPGTDPAPVVPGPLGAHSWQPMSFDPLTGLVYIPVNDVGFKYKSPDQFEVKSLAPNYGVDVVAAGMPQDPKIKAAILGTVKGKLVAWDPLQQKQAWAIERDAPWNGGVLSTAGNLVFEGTADGAFEAYRADNGQKLWTFTAETGVMAGPVAYEVNGEQYIAVLSGWGGVFPLATGEIALKLSKPPNLGRMLAFKIGGKDALPAVQPPERPALNPPPSTASAASIKSGEALYQRYCAECHGDVAVSGGVLPDLRYSSALANDGWFHIVLDGLLQPHGMVSFKKELSRGNAAAIRAYVIFRANQSLARQTSPHN
ncbi:MAG TPA: PQQ-dependent dehydrogenase, methanol/ethanol family [Candidatus Acidoferrales bacterium]|nr:PQQ-dependent dehydrogenase, methanol/ethanol family [Candidatus Acidoferrales bacterium]